MYLHVRCCAIVLVLASTLLQQPASKSRESSDTEELSRLEAAWNEAYVRGDADAVGRLCADDLIVTMSTSALGGNGHPNNS